MIQWKKIIGIGIDLDGVVYLGDSLIGQADKTIKSLRNLGFKIFFLTNNSALSRKSLIKKLNLFGVSCGSDEILTSSLAAAEYLKARAFNNVAVVGTKELCNEIESFGIRTHQNNDLEKPDSLLVGFNPQFSYQDLARASEAIRMGAYFVAANRDSTYPIENGKLMPACGPLVQAVEAAGGRSADFVAGKPNPWMLEIVASRLDANPDQLLMIGDSLTSDILMATSFGCSSILIGGIAKTHDLKPDLCLSNLDSILEFF